MCLFAQQCDPGPDGKCKICGDVEGDHYHHSNGNKYCRGFQMFTFELDDDGKCAFCSKDEGDHVWESKVCPFFTFVASGGDENKCGRCDKFKEHHHNKKRDGTISKSEWCYDFLLDL